MSLTYQALIDLASEQSGVQESELKAEALAPVAMLRLAVQVAADPLRRSLLQSTATVTFTNGVADVPTSTLIGALRNSSLYDTVDTSAEYTYIEDFDDFRKDPETRLGRYNVRNTVLTVIQPGEVYVPLNGLSGTLNFTASTVPQVPSLAVDPIFGLPPELEPGLVNILAALMSGV